MAVTVRTDLGEVKISEQVIAGIISDVLAESEISDRIWPATAKGHRIGKRSMIGEIIDPGDSDLASNIETVTDKNGAVTVEFSVIVRFGISIKAATRLLSDKIVDAMEYILGIRPSVMIINIAGVKSKQIARRNTRTIYRYDSNETD